MLWRKIRGRTYPIRTSTRATQTSVGLEAPETKTIYKKFTAGKKLIEEKRAGLRKALAKYQQLNRALYVGRINDKIIDIRNGLYDAGLENNFIVVGANAMYAYESAAGVRIEERRVVTNNLGSLWGNRRKLILGIKDGLLEDGLIEMLKRVDKTFELRSGQLYAAVSEDGFEVDIIRRMGPGSDKVLGQITGHDDDFWAVRARNTDWFLSVPKFGEVVVGASGRMALMVTADPRVFALFKLWPMRDKDRDPLKRTRDGNQAQVAVNLINDRLPQLSFDDIKVFPTELADMLPAKN